MPCANARRRLESGWLSARPRLRVRWTILRQAGLVLGTGVLAGTVGALLFGRWLTSLAFQISPWDARILLTAVLLLTITGAVAAWLPARRASRVPPGIAMQETY